LSKKWENAMTIDRNSWGWNRNASFADYLTTAELVHTIINTISKNGNLNINIGPAADGTISPILVDRLLGLGDWLKVNGEAVYQTRPWNVCSNDTDGVYYTRSKDTLYAHHTHWPKGNRIALTCPLQTTQTNTYMVGLNKDDDLSVELEDAVGRTRMTLHLPPHPMSTYTNGLAI
jgi:alpha-L-fucosidase